MTDVEMEAKRLTSLYGPSQGAWHAICNAFGFRFEEPGRLFWREVAASICPDEYPLDKDHISRGGNLLDARAGIDRLFYASDRRKDP